MERINKAKADYDAQIAYADEQLQAAQATHDKQVAYAEDAFKAAIEAATATETATGAAT